ncbi:hypothetical protein SCHPADRAFT_923640 [Schizopora paradoxa]|uniref:Uncharacterized protein n=1 Tax=Schizopora paradoxa TaxID=27342 RepID=A0A0H2S886_9AGAM|nr:hypothetical protein SCHPADRAFT_923640 [Schizopora paradoxa]
MVIMERCVMRELEDEKGEKPRGETRSMGDRRLLLGGTDGLRAAGTDVDDGLDVFRGEDERMGVVNRDIGACQRRRRKREEGGQRRVEASFLIKATCPSRGGDIPVISIVLQLATSRSVDGLEEVVVVVVVDNNVAVPKSFASVEGSLIAVQSCDVRTHSKVFARLAINFASEGTTQLRLLTPAIALFALRAIPADTNKAWQPRFHPNI